MNQSAPRNLTATPEKGEVLLEIRGLSTQFETREGRLRAVDNLSLKLRRGQTMGLVGESGCGKSMLAYSLLRLVPPPGRVVHLFAFAALLCLAGLTRDLVNRRQARVQTDAA